MKKRVDHRKTERFSLQVPVRIQPVQKPEDEDGLELIPSNICSGGAYFQTDNPLPVGTEVNIEMVLPLDKLEKIEGKQAHVRVSGEVIRASENGMAIGFQDDYVISPLS